MGQSEILGHEDVERPPNRGHQRRVWRVHNMPGQDTRVMHSSSMADETARRSVHSEERDTVALDVPQAVLSGLKIDCGG